MLRYRVELSMYDRQRLWVNYVARAPLDNATYMSAEVAKQIGKPEAVTEIAAKIEELGLAGEVDAGHRCPGHCGVDFCEAYGCLHNGLVKAQAEREAQAGLGG